MIRSEETIEIGRPPADVFRFLDDESNTPKWNPRAVEVKRTSPGEKSVGTRLHYVYRDPGRQGEMDGEVTGYEKDRKLAMKFSDRMMDVSVVFELSPAPSGTRVHHFVEIEMKSLIGRLMTPIIRSATRKQVRTEVENLKGLVEKA